MVDEGQDHRGADGAPRGADAFAVERVTDGDVALDGEREDEQRTEVLRRQKDHRERLAQSWPLQQRHAPLHLQLEEYLTHTYTHTPRSLLMII